MLVKTRIMKAFSFLLITGLILALMPSGLAKADGMVNDRATAISLATHKLINEQNEDGGFAWQLPDPAGSSYTNVLGITAISILKWQQEVSDKSAYYESLAKAYKYVVDKEPIYEWDGTKYNETTKGVDSFPDITFLIWLAEAAANDSVLLGKISDLQGSTVTSEDIAKLAQTRWDDMVLYKGSTTQTPNGTATTMAERIRDSRHSQNYDSLILWDLEAAVKAALTLHEYFPLDGYNSQAQDIGDVILASINDGTYFDSYDTNQDDYVLGLTGAIEAFSELNTNSDTAMELKAILLGLQKADGSWDYYGSAPASMSVQATAYAVMALVKKGDDDALIGARKGANWLVKNQKADGGWYSEGGTGDEYLEIDSEAAWALFCADAPITIATKGYYTIQSAIDAASNGDTINVSEGTYDEENILISKGITLQGAGAANTYIAPSSVTNNSTIVVQNPTGNVKIDGFTFTMQPKENYGSAILVTGTSISLDAVTVTISNNVVNGSDDGTKSDFGFYGQGNNAKLIITNNVINKTGDNPIVMENQSGSTTVSNNIFYITSSPDYNPYFSMAYNGTTVTTPQIVEGNTFYLDHSGSGYSEAITFDTAVLNAWNGVSTDTGHYSNIQIKDNKIYTGGAYARGVGLFDLSSADGNGTISDAEITGNQIIGELPTDEQTFGITLRGDIEGTLIEDNTISNIEMGIWLRSGLNLIYPTNVDIQDNALAPLGTAVKNDGSTVVDASPNWWGSPCGPTNIVGEIDFDPWYINDSMTTPATLGSYVIPSGSTTSELNDIMACAAPNTTITFEGGPYPGGIEVISNELTFNLNGSTLGAGSPAFIINADNIIINGPGKIDGLGSTDPGILVNAGSDNFILNGVEVTNWQDGVQVAGAVESLKIVNNWIHDNNDSGLQVDADPTGIVTIEGNLFKANGGNGITAGGSSLKAEYNSWGDIGGPAGTNGDGVSSNVDAEPFTFVEFFVDVDPDNKAFVRNVDENVSFDVKLKADAVNLYGLTFKLTYDNHKLHLNSQNFSDDWTDKCTVLSSEANEFKYFCNRTTAWNGGTILTLNFTASGSDLTGDGPWDALFDISHLVADTSAGAYGGAKVYVNNAGYGASNVTDITDSDDGKVTIRGIAQFTGYIDLQGRANDAGAALAVYNQQGKSGSSLLANATSSSGGGFTTSYFNSNILTIGTDYWLFADAWLYLPTTRFVATDWTNSKTLTNRPITALATLVLLGGDATNDDTIALTDATCIGGNYNGSGVACGDDSSGWSDVNGDGVVNILDLVMMGTNYDKDYSPWEP